MPNGPCEQHGEADDPELEYVRRDGHGDEVPIKLDSDEDFCDNNGDAYP